jgi:antitoxin (DNA-binding transcriptional repressor) of toxin-antitoxin stability system
MEGIGNVRTRAGYSVLLWIPRVAILTQLSESHSPTIENWTSSLIRNMKVGVSQVVAICSGNQPVAALTTFHRRLNVTWFVGLRSARIVTIGGVLPTLDVTFRPIEGVEVSLPLGGIGFRAPHVPHRARNSAQQCVFPETKSRLFMPFHQAFLPICPGHDLLQGLCLAQLKSVRSPDRRRSRPLGERRSESVFWSARNSGVEISCPTRAPWRNFFAANSVPTDW